MFKKFGGREDVSSVGMIKSSQQRAIRRAIEEAYGAAMGGEEVLEQVLPRRATIYLARCKDHITLLCIDNVPLFFQHFDGPFLPTLRTLHRFPTMMAAVRVDQGATKYILQGADIMCPGLTNARGHLPPLLAIGTPVAIMADEKEHAMAVGIMKMTSAEIVSINAGHGIENVHYLNDGLWRTPTVG